MAGTQQGRTVAVLGLGMIGGSLAHALRHSGFAGRILAYDRDRAALETGLARGTIDAACSDLAAVLAAELVIIAAPNLAAAELLSQLLALLDDRPGPVITDVASVKGNLAARAGGAARYVPGHPIAGSERSGVAAADGGLFAGHRVILTPLPTQEPAALALVRALWESVGAEVVEMAVDEHDAVLAATSHLPHMLAFCLVDALAHSPRRDDLFRFAAGGFRDFTRIASSDPVMWRDVALANREALLAAMDEFSARLATLRDAIEAGDGERLARTFSAAKRARDAFAHRDADRHDV